MPVLGIDVAETALATAQLKAKDLLIKAKDLLIKDRQIKAEFIVADAFHLESLGRGFDTVLDCGLFHTFDGAERPRYVASLSSVTRHNGTLYVLCFSDEGREVGPHPISQRELEQAFRRENGWSINTIQPNRIETRFHNNGAPAWLATISRI